MSASRAAPAILAILIAGCGGGEKAKAPLPDAPERIALTSPAFDDGQRIPKRFTCDGEDLPPPLRWSGVPPRAKAEALLMEDLTAKGFVHWAVIDLPPAVRSARSGRAPPGGAELPNSFGDEGWGGPCPPDDDGPHRYEFSVYALRAPLRLSGDATPEEVRTKLGDEAIARGTLTGRFR